MLLWRNEERNRVSYTINNRKPFNPLNTLDSDTIIRCKEFAMRCLLELKDSIEPTERVEET